MLLRAHAAYLATAWGPSAAPPEKHVVQPGETLSMLADMYNLASWKYLYSLNEDTVGDNPDLLKPGTELSIPQWDTTSGDEKR